IAEKLIIDVARTKHPKTNELEVLSFDFNLCEAIATWEQVQNSTIILTKEFIASLPNGWEDHAWRMINKGILLVYLRYKTTLFLFLAFEQPGGGESGRCTGSLSYAAPRYDHVRFFLPTTLPPFFPMETGDQKEPNASKPSTPVERRCFSFRASKRKSVGLGQRIPFALVASLTKSPGAPLVALKPTLAGFQAGVLIDLQNREKEDERNAYWFRFVAPPAAVRTKSTDLRGTLLNGAL
ncbi:hypothetical protein S83_051050, partial [Arachis hypogaea]